MAHYILSFLEEAEAKARELTLAPEITEDILVHHIIPAKEAVQNLANKPNHTPEEVLLLEQMSKHAQSLRDLLFAAEPVGAFMNSIELLHQALIILVMWRQEQCPETKARLAAQHAAHSEREARLQSLRNGFTGNSPSEPQAPPVEQILGTSRQTVMEVLTDGEELPTGFIAVSDDHNHELLFSDENIQVRPRPEAETDPSWKQFVVYAVVIHNGKVLCYTRGKKGAEKRLHAKKSIGIGGHVNEDDIHPFSDPVSTALHRELEEECGIDFSHILDDELIGLVNNELDEVGKVHIGFVYAVRLVNLESLNFEDSFVEPTWYDLETLQEMAAAGQFEAWSELLIPHLIGLNADLPCECNTECGCENPLPPFSDEEREFQPPANVNDREVGQSPALGASYRTQI